MFSKGTTYGFLTGAAWGLDLNGLAAANTRAGRELLEQYYPTVAVVEPAAEKRSWFSKAITWTFVSGAAWGADSLGLGLTNVGQELLAEYFPTETEEHAETLKKAA